MKRNNSALLAVGLAVLAVIAAGTVAGLGTAGADTPTEQPSQRTIAVDATGQAETAPDKAVVRFAVTATGDDPGQIRDELADGASQLRDQLDELGVDYETRDYSIDENRNREPHESGPSEGVSQGSYRGAHVFVVTLDDTDAVGTVVDSAASVGAEVGNIQLTLSDEKREQLREQAIQDAMGDARQQATTVAESGNLELTGVVSVDASERRYRPVAYDGDAAATEGAAEPPTQVDAGDVTVTYNVDVTFEATP